MVSEMQKRIFSKLELLSKQKNFLKFWNITSEQGFFLANLVDLIEPKSVLEIGTSNGFSGLFLNLNLPEGSRFVTVEIDSGRFEVAKQNFLDCGLDYVECLNCDVLEFLSSSEHDCFDLVFIDAGHCLFEKIFSGMIDGGFAKSGSVLVFDNVCSHKSLSGFVKKVFDEYDCELIEIGGGMLVVNL